MDNFSINNSDNSDNKPKTVRRLFDFGQHTPPPVEAEQIMADPVSEMKNIVKRLMVIFGDHRQAAIPLNIKLNSADLQCVINALRNHAKGGQGLPVEGARDEVHGHCLNRLFEELVEEPSNILFTTKKGPDSIRYDAMNAAFWIECLDHMESVYCPPE